ncbi:MAG: response regulator [Verrucomicrobiae bacterium]|nr:response regulator [Verrucomicrobiae bacterium]
MSLGASPSIPANERASSLPDLQHVRFSHIGTEDGLASSTVTCVVQDRDGVTWMGTDSGLCRFDGAQIRVFHQNNSGQSTLSSDHISAIELGPDGILWVGTHNGGLNRFDPVTEKNERYFGSQPLPGQEIVSLSLDGRGNLWVGTGQGLARLRLSDGRVTIFEIGAAQSRVSAMERGLHGGMWVAMQDGRLFHWDAERDRLDLKWKSASPLTALTFDRHQALWIGTQGTGLFRLAVDKPDAMPAAASSVGITPGEVPGKVVTGLHSDLEGHLWVATPLGLCRLDRSTRRSAIYRPDPLDPGSLSSLLINEIWEDARGVLWIATDGAGVNRLELDRFGFELVRLNQPAKGILAASAIWGFSERHDGSVWIGTESGLKHWHPDTGWIAEPSIDLPEKENRGNEEVPGFEDAPFVQALWEDGFGRVWMGTRGEGLLRAEVDGKIVRLTHQQGEGAGLPHDSVTVIHEDVDGHLWIGTMGGGVVRCLESGEKMSFLSALTIDSVPPKNDEETAITGGYEPSPQCRHVTAIARDGAGRTWVASWEGLFLLDRKLGQLTYYQALDPKPDALSADGLLSLAADRRGFLWIGTVNGGLNRFDPATGEVRKFDRTGNGLPDDRVVGVLPDKQGFIWVSTGRGIARLDPDSGQVRLFSEGDGLQRGAFHAGAAARLSSGDLIFGGANGFNVIRPTCLPEEKVPAAPVLAGISVSGEPLIPHSGGILEEPLSRTQSLTLPFDGKSRLSFRLAPGQLVDTDRFYYRFRLDGQDLHWSIAGNHAEAVYTGLNPGRYQFVSQTSFDGRNWSPEAGVALVVSPPWFRTWWAWILFVLVGAVVIWLASTGINRTRLQYQRRLRERAEQQRDRAEAELARQLQHALLLEQAGQKLGKSRDVAQLFENATHHVADQFGADRCAIISCTSGEAETDSEMSDNCRLTVMASYPASAGEWLRSGVIPVDVQAALRAVVQHREVREIMANGATVSEEADQEALLRKHFSPEGNLTLRRTTFLDEINGVIVLQSRESAGLGNASLKESRLQMLDALSKQIGTAIAQWRIAEKERRHRQVLESARKSAESANQAKSDFLAKMTHELRTPLNAILGFSEVMNEDPDLNDRQREVMAIINNSGEHLHEVINGVLDLAKIEAGKIEVFPARFELERMLRSMHKMLSLRARSKGLEFPFEMLTALPRVVETDKSKVRQVLINLLGNAIKFTDEGSVRLVTWAEIAGEVTNRENIRKRPVRIYFEVRDTGKGIAKEDIETLFDQYTQTDAGKASADSTGLGLAIAKAFAELLGGGIEVESEVGKGTTFRLSVLCYEVSTDLSKERSDRCLPQLSTTSRENAPATPRARRLAADQPEVRILIAEDQMPNRLLLKKLLGPAGFSLREAENGEEAVEQWREWQPHLILMDEQMPKMTGRQATQAIVAEAAANEAYDEDELPVIVALTAFALDQNRSAAIEAGCSDFLAKPFRSEELFGVLARNLPGVRFEGDAPAADRSMANDSSDAVMLAG